MITFELEYKKRFIVLLVAVELHCSPQAGK